MNIPANVYPLQVSPQTVSGNRRVDTPGDVYISDKKIPVVRNILHTLYSCEFTQSTILNLATSVCEVIESHYLAVLFFPNRFVKQPFFISNNPPEFIPVYTPLIPKDFLIKHLVNTFRITLLHELADWGFQQSDEFCIEVQKVRPISDVAYVPMMIHGNLVGYWALGRAGLNSPFYSENDVALFRFLTGFLTEAYNRSLLPPAVSEDVALLDAYGRVVQIGKNLKEVFIELFGPKFFCYPGSGMGKMHNLFRQKFSAFFTGCTAPGRAEITLPGRFRSYTLFFSYLEGDRLRLFMPAEPQVKVALWPYRIVSQNESILDLNLLSSRYSLTSRELSVVQGIYQGYTNKDIASSLKIGESTVKRQISSIFEKVGVSSRSCLVIKLGVGL
ncbi:MAG: helix-turn-helix transcriptional regulator [Spirochaetales bacterium]